MPYTSHGHAYGLINADEPRPTAIARCGGPGLCKKCAQEAGRLPRPGSAPRRFRKKPVEVEAVQWTGDNEAELVAFTGSLFHAVAPEDRGDDPDQTAAVFDTLHNTWVRVYDGQWIVKGVRGEFYPIAPDVLAGTYTLVDPEAGRDDFRQVSEYTHALAKALREQQGKPGGEGEG